MAAITRLIESRVAYWTAEQTHCQYLARLLGPTPLSGHADRSLRKASRKAARWTLVFLMVGGGR